MIALVASQAEVPTLARLADAGIRKWAYLGHDTGRRLELERGHLAGLERIATAASLQRRARELRGPFIDWIGSLSVENASTEWWATELAAKSQYTFLFLRICSLAVAQELVTDASSDPLLVVCSTAALTHQVAALAGNDSEAPSPASPPERRKLRMLRAWERAAPAPLRRLLPRMVPKAQSLLDQLPEYRRRVLAEHELTTPPLAGPKTVLVLTWIDDRSFAEDGTYSDAHLGALPRLLADAGYTVGFVARVIPTTRFAGAVERTIATGETVYFPDALLEPDDWLDCTERARRYSPRIPADASVATVPAAALAREHLEEWRPFSGEVHAHEALIRRLAERGVRPERIVHTYEGHGWEQVVAEAARRYMPGTEVIAYENLNMSRFALSMYPSRSELGLRPLPDRIVTNGETFKRVLLEEGLPPELVQVGCGLRHGYLAEIDPAPTSTAGQARVLVATDASYGQAAELVEKALSAFADDPAYEVVVKYHPLLDAHTARAAAEPLASAGNVRFSREPIGDLLRSADVMLYTYSVVPYEALAHGVRPIFVQAETAIDLDQLEPYASLRGTARTPDELREAVRDALDHDAADTAAWRTRARDAVREVLRPTTPACIEAFVA